MSLKTDLPGYRQAVAEGGSAPISRAYYVYLQNIATTVDGLSAASGNATAPELPISENANVVGASGFSVYTQGTLKNGIVRVLLMGDTQNPGNTQYYGSGPTGERGWYAVSDALDSTTNITLSVGADGVTTFDLADLANSGTGAALVKLTRDSKGRISGTSSASTSDLAEGSNLYFTNARAAAASPVQSVNGKTGTVSLTASDVGAATTAQGAKADSAVQSIVAGTGISVDVTDPQNPVVSTTGSGSGDVVGPASATDSDVALFDGTTGKLLKDGGSLGAAVRTAVLTGLSTATSAVIAATDTVLGALGKLQAQITDNLLPSDFIAGGQLVWVNGTAVTVRACAFYVPSLGKVLRSGTDIAKTGLSLSASTMYYLYGYSNAGTADVELSTTAPAIPYSGSARCKIGDNSRRFLGAVLTDSGGSITSFSHAVAQGRIDYRTNIGPTPFRVLSNGRATTETSLSLAAIIPTGSTHAVAFMYNSSDTTQTALFSASDGASLPSGFEGFVASGTQLSGVVRMDASLAITYAYQGAPAGSNGFTVRIGGYIFGR
ncbi:hypothetical protein ACFWZU_15740 [Frateuria sp. GZRR33]|uniref:hypothetical protein n=1 Tax=Frateuria sp. GZRR33 TaxID=3351535 RepID=UPI003EDBF789